MVYIRFNNKGCASYGEVADGEVFPLTCSPFESQAGPPARSGAAVGALQDLELLPPCQPTKVIAAARNWRYPGRPCPDVPEFFMKPPNSVIPHLGDIVVPRMSAEIIHEAEVGIVIGRPARYVGVEDIGDYILGYTCANDVTADDLIGMDRLPFRGKSFDTFCPLGPVIACGLDPSDLVITCRVNGDLRQRGSTAGLCHGVLELVSFLSQITTLLPGDVVLTGTPPGLGPLAIGDSVEVEVSGVGVLRNTVIAPV